MLANNTGIRTQSPDPWEFAKPCPGDGCAGCVHCVRELNTIADVVLRYKPARFVGNIADLQEMVKLGYTHKEIAGKYGMDRASITMLLNREGFESQEASVVSQVRNCENAWDNIINFEPRSVETKARVDAVNDPAGWEIHNHGIKSE